MSDFNWYASIGSDIANGQGFVHLGIPPVLRTPGYSILLALADVLSPNRLLADRILTIALAVGTLWLAYLVARILFASELIARLTLLILALFPNQVAYSNLIASETPFCFFTLLGTWLLIRREPRLGAYLGAGASFGAALLIRPQAIVFAAVILPMSLWRFGWKTIARGTIVVSVMMGLFLAPWLIRNQIALGSPVYATTDGESLLEGTFTSSQLHGKLVTLSEKLVPLSGNPVADDKHRLRYAIHYIRTHPATFLKAFPRKLVVMYDGDSDAFLWTIEGLGFEHRASLLEWTGIGNAYFFVILALSVLGLFLIGLARKTRDRWWLMPAVIVAVTTISYLPFLALQRYHAPLIPWISMYAAAAIASVVERWTGNRGGRSRSDDPSKSGGVTSPAPRNG